MTHLPEATVTTVLLQGWVLTPCLAEPAMIRCCVAINGLTNDDFVSGGAGTDTVV